MSLLLPAPLLAEPECEADPRRDSTERGGLDDNIDPTSLFGDVNPRRVVTLLRALDVECAGGSRPAYGK